LGVHIHQKLFPSRSNSATALSGSFFDALDPSPQHPKRYATTTVVTSGAVAPRLASQRPPLAVETSSSPSTASSLPDTRYIGAPQTPVRALQFHPRESCRTIKPPLHCAWFLERDRRTVLEEIEGLFVVNGGYFHLQHANDYPGA